MFEYVSIEEIEEQFGKAGYKIERSDSSHIILSRGVEKITLYVTYMDPIEDE